MTPDNLKTPNIWLLLDSSGLGGIETHVLVLANELKRAGASVQVVLLTDFGAHPLFARHKDVQVKQLKGPGDFWNRVRRECPDVVHTHGYKAGFLGRIICKLTGIPVVSTFHSGDRGQGRLKLYSLLDEKTSFLATSISVSAEIGERLSSTSEIIPNFVSPAAKRKIKEGKRRVVGFVGRLSHEKGPDIFCRLADKLPATEFLIFGDGPMRSTLELENHKAHFRGFVHEMDTVWAEIDILCISSRSEGLPLVALEAMAHGIPVVAFGVGDLPKLITHKSGKIVAPGNVDALFAALCEFVNLPEKQLNNMGQSGTEVILNNYSARIQVPRIIAAYQRAARDSHWADFYAA